ncbi:dipeptidase [Bacteroidales bacterium OttesenSCG-928-A17]|nr:dipeptidase [Bacteroidales bacterium OttesenSCG-928-A17]
MFIGIENGYGIGKDLKNLKKFKDAGVTYITLSHNGDNDICDSASGHNEHKGLSEFGKEVIREMNRLGIMIDISHTSEKTSFDVLELSEKPIIASHSSAKSLCNHPRNLSDELMRAIAQKGGVVQVCLYHGFIKKGGKATLKDAVDHIDYIVKTIGIDHVGIGSDFDGGGGLIGLQAVNEYPQLTMGLLRRGYSEEDIAKIWGENLLRVMSEIMRSDIEK